jgi:hypothetical protein
VGIVTQNQQTVRCEVLTDSGQTVEGSSERSDTEPETVQCEVLTENGQTLEESNVHIETEPKYCTV